MSPTARGARRAQRRGLSLERLPPPRAVPLPHAVTLDAPPRRPRRDRPPLRRSLRLEDDAAAADERRRMFGRGPRAPSFDEDDASDDHPADCECRSSLEHSGPSADTADDEEESELVAFPPRAVPRSIAPPPAPARAQSQGVFERRLPRIYKFGLMDKSKRASSSALYERAERSPTEAFYNATGSTRLSSQELFEKFCSEEFTSLYGRGDGRRRPPHSKSTGSSGSDVRTCCRRGAGGSHPALARRVLPPRSDRSTDSEDTSPHNGPPRTATTDCSRSAPLLSPDRFEARFTFDISERSEVTSCRDDTPSDATETRNLTLYEEPHSDRTSVCELYDAVMASQRPSLRRRDGTFDLSALDFRAIDDDSPRASRRASRRSEDDTLRQNSESRSWASDSVFATPERRAVTTSPSSTDTRRTARPPDDSTLADSTVADDDQPSVIERGDCPLSLARLELAVEAAEALNPPAAGSMRLSSRASMHKLEPLDAASLTGGGAGSSMSAKKPRARRGASEPRRSGAGRCFPL